MGAKRTRRVTFLLSEEEMQTLGKIAVKYRRTVSDTIREVIGEAWEKISDEDKKSLDSGFGHGYTVIPIGAGDSESSE